MIYRYKELKDEFIIEFEEEQIAKIQRVIESWRDKFKNYGCILKLDVFWLNKRGEILNKREPFNINYSCNVSCTVLQNNCIVIDAEDEDAALSVCWPIVQAYKEFLLSGDIIVYLIDQEDYIEIEGDMNGFYNVIMKLSDKELI